jgi:hypothetical protein
MSNVHHPHWGALETARHAPYDALRASYGTWRAVSRSQFNAWLTSHWGSLESGRHAPVRRPAGRWRAASSDHQWIETLINVVDIHI